MSNMKRFVIPIIIEATGIVNKGLKYICRNIRKSFNRFCKIKTVLGASHITSKVLQSETWSLSGGMYHC